MVDEVKMRTGSPSRSVCRFKSTFDKKLLQLFDFLVTIRKNGKNRRQPDFDGDAEDGFETPAGAFLFYQIYLPDSKPYKVTVLFPALTRTASEKPIRCYPIYSDVELRREGTNDSQSCTLLPAWKKTAAEDRKEMHDAMGKSCFPGK